MNYARSILAVLLCVVLVGCAGIEVRNKVLIPTLQSVWPAIRADAERGGADPVELDQFAEHLREGDKPGIVALWPSVHQAAAAGIQFRVDNAEVSPGVAASFNERLRQFSLAVDAIARRVF